MFSLLQVFASLASISFASGFTSTVTSATTTRQSTGSLNVLPLVGGLEDVSTVSDAISSSSHVLSSLLIKQVEPENAEKQFYFLFFAGSGAGGIGILQIPKILKELGVIRKLSKEGPTEGGEGVAKNPLVSLLYPSAISKKDVLKVISKVPKADVINKRGSSKAYFATKGYIVQDDFLEACKGCNPIASYAVYQAITKGSGKTVSPITTDERMALYKAEAKSSTTLDQFLNDFQAAAFTKVLSYTTLLFLLFLTFDLIIETGMNAFL